jgi:ketosteroid isomerase-like protein
VASENEELYRRGVAAFNRRDKEAWMAACDPEIESVPPRDWPEQATAKGHDGVWDIMVANMGIFDAAALEIVGPIDEGDGGLVGHLEGTMSGKESGAPVIWSFHQVVTIREGLAVRFDWFTDRAEALDAAGIGEPAG